MAAYLKNNKLAFCLLSPQLLVILFFFVWPACSMISQSLFFSDPFGIHRRFAFLANFSDLLQDFDYIRALWLTIIIAFAITTITMSLGLAIATLVHGCGRTRGLYKSLLIWPYAVAPAVAAILWRFLFHPNSGWMVQVLGYLGIDFNYLIHANQAILMIIMTASWQQFSYNFLFFFAALNIIPSALIDAAIIDGASAWRRFRDVIFPLLAPTSFFLLVMNIIYAIFDTFGIIHIITNGGPSNSTTTLMYKLYKDGFGGMDPGSASAQSLILMLIVSVLVLVQFFYLDKKVHYE